MRYGMFGYIPSEIPRDPQVRDRLWRAAGLDLEVIERSRMEFLYRCGSLV